MNEIRIELFRRLYHANIFWTLSIRPLADRFHSLSVIIFLLFSLVIHIFLKVNSESVAKVISFIANEYFKYGQIEITIIFFMSHNCRNAIIKQNDTRTVNRK